MLLFSQAPHGVLREATGVKCDTVTPVLGAGTDGRDFACICSSGAPWRTGLSNSWQRCQDSALLLCLGMPEMDLKEREIGIQIGGGKAVQYYYHFLFLWSQGSSGSELRGVLAARRLRWAKTVEWGEKS
ncbi:hypothetical protein EYF80_007394 [Liparis tanakae]|uniref:Uncharacterized protein n=1 Tax=Liparis tanakae TaxID=230148 RepID=A0A4Z2IXL5_9TELE|nr:hypothetical protein EYF80_007394 [Liparis tanakae]